jgi:hypothetical protein
LYFGEFSLSHALTFWAPGLLDKLRVKEAKEALSTLKLPALQSILAKSDRFAAKPQNFYQQASFLFHQPECLPIAATQAKAELKTFNANHFWLSVDPVQMVADRDTLVLIPGKALQISKDESHQLIEAFNQHFAEDKVELIWASANHWYLSIVQSVDIKTTVIDKVAYQSVNDFYPTGNAAQYWRQLLNETQMLFYTHPVNEARRDKGWPEINSVWVWGEGKISPEKVKVRMDAAIYSNHPYLKGMAKLCQSQISPVPESYQAWLSGIDQSPTPRINKHLICLDNLSSRLDDLQMSEWVELLQQLEKDWFEPLMSAVKQGTIDSLLLDLGQEYHSHLTTAHMKRFWRFKKSLSKA